MYKVKDKNNTASQIDALTERKQKKKTN